MWSLTLALASNTTAHDKKARYIIGYIRDLPCKQCYVWKFNAFVTHFMWLFIDPFVHMTKWPRDTEGNASF